MKFLGLREEKDKKSELYKKSIINQNEQTHGAEKNIQSNLRKAINAVLTNELLINDLIDLYFEVNRQKIQKKERKFQPLTNTANFFSNINSAVSTYSKAKGARAELASLSMTSGGISRFLKNGLLEELSLVDNQKIINAAYVVFNNPKIRELLKTQKLEEIDLDINIIPIIKSFVSLIQKFPSDSQIGSNLSLSLANLLDNFEKLKNTKDSSEIKRIKSENDKFIRSIRENISVALTSYAKEDLKNIFIFSLPIITNLIERQAKLISKDEKDKVLGVQLAEIKFLIEEKGYNFKSLMSIVQNIAIRTIDNKPEVLKEFIDNAIKYSLASENDRNIEFLNLFRTVIKLINDEKILSYGLLLKKDRAPSKAYFEQSQLTLLAINARKLIDSISREYVDEIFSENVIPIVHTLINDPSITKDYRLNEEKINALNELLPHFLSQIKEILFYGLQEREKVKNILDLVALQEKDDQKLFSEVIKLILDKGFIDIVFDKNIWSDPSTSNLICIFGGIEDERKTIIEKLLPEAREYLQNIAYSLKVYDSELVEIIGRVKDIKEAQPENKGDKILQLSNSFTNLISKPEVLNATFDPIFLSRILSPAGIFKEDLTNLSNALKESTPKILLALNHAQSELFKSEDVKNLFAKASALLVARDISLKDKEIRTEKIKEIAKSFISIIAQREDLHQSFNEEIKKEKELIAKTINDSLASVEKRNLKLKLLKPLGINGDLMVKMLERISNKKDIQVLNDLIDKPNLTGAIKFLKQTNNLSFVVGHMTKSVSLYLYDFLIKDPSKNIKPKGKNKVTPIESFAKKISETRNNSSRGRS